MPPAPKALEMSDKLIDAQTGAVFLGPLDGRLGAVDHHRLDRIVAERALALGESKLSGRGQRIFGSPDDFECI